MDLVPPEVLTKIFSYLSKRDLFSRTSQVCLYWNAITFTSELWGILDVSNCTNESFEVYLDNVFMYKNLVQHLFIKADHLMELLDNKEIESFTKVQNLQIVNYLPSNEVRVFTDILSKFPKLSSIRFRIFRSADISECLKVLSKRTLTDVDMYFSKVTHATKLNDNLDRFFRKQYRISSVSIHSPDLQNKTVTHILESLKDLKHLNLANNPSLYGNVFTTLTESCKITSIELTDTKIDDTALMCIAPRVNLLKSLILVFCANLSDKSIECISQYCPHLENLTIINSEKECGIELESHTLWLLGTGCRDLKHVIFRNCSGMSNSGIMTLVQQTRKLETMALESTRLSAPSLLAISEFCINLRKLDVTCNSFDSESLQQLLTEHLFLEELSLFGCSDLQSISFSYISQKKTDSSHKISPNHCHIKSLVLDASMELNDVLNLLTFCPDIRHLAVKSIYGGDQETIINQSFKTGRFLNMLSIKDTVINKRDLKPRLQTK